MGYRVKSGPATQFRIWATNRLREYIVKGFVLDDERLKSGVMPDLRHDHGFVPTFPPDAIQERPLQQVGFLPIDSFFRKTIMNGQRLGIH